MPNVKIPNRDWRNNPECNNPEKRIFLGNITKLGEGKRKVRLSQDGMPILGEGERD
jgi:hypothetical protein